MRAIEPSAGKGLGAVRWRIVCLHRAASYAFLGGEEDIAKQKRVTGRTEIGWDPGQANPKQLEVFNSRTLYTAYGGAKGGGKTWAVRTKAIGGALLNPGIRILIMRCHYPE